MDSGDLKVEVNRVRRDFTEEERVVLEEAWNGGMKSTKCQEAIRRVAERLGFEEDRVKVWIGNRNKREHRPRDTSKRRVAVVRGQTAYNVFASGKPRGTLPKEEYLHNLAEEWKRLAEPKKQEYQEKAKKARAEMLKGMSPKAATNYHLKVISKSCEVLESLGCEIGGFGVGPSSSISVFGSERAQNFFDNAELQMEFVRAVKSEVTVVEKKKEDKLELKEKVRRVFNSCYARVTGKKCMPYKAISEGSVTLKYEGMPCGILMKEPGLYTLNELKQILEKKEDIKIVKLNCVKPSTATSTASSATSTASSATSTSSTTTSIGGLIDGSTASIELTNTSTDARLASPAVATVQAIPVSTALSAGPPTVTNLMDNVGPESIVERITMQELDLQSIAAADEMASSMTVDKGSGDTDSTGFDNQQPIRQPTPPPAIFPLFGIDAISDTQDKFRINGIQDHEESVIESHADLKKCKIVSKGLSTRAAVRRKASKQTEQTEVIKPKKKKCSRKEKGEDEEKGESEEKGKNGMYAVEKVLEQKIIKGTVYCKIKWKNYKKTTWEPADNIIDVML